MPWFPPYVPVGARRARVALVSDELRRNGVDVQPGNPGLPRVLEEPGDSMITKSAGLLPGTLDLLILKAGSLDCLHGYGVLLPNPADLQRCLQPTCGRARSIRRSTGSSARGSSSRNGAREKAGAVPSTTG